MITNKTKIKVAKILPAVLRDETISISGYKHASNLIIATAILLPNMVFQLENIPDVLDTHVLIDILQYLGGKVSFSNGIYTINTKGLINRSLPTEITSQVHGTLYLLPALLCRFGEVEIGKCGGCPIGERDVLGNSRPIAHIIKVLEQFGATFTIDADNIKGKLKKIISPENIDIQPYSDDSIELTGQYVSGATKTAILCALVCNTKVLIKNPYIKADVRELLKFLSLAGISIDRTRDALSIHNNSTVNHVKHFIMSDINEIFTYITFAITNGLNLKLNQVTVQEVKEAFIQENIIFSKMGITINWNENDIDIKKCKKIIACDIDIGQAEKYSVYADHQPFLALLLTMGDRSSTIKDRVWKKRFQYVPELLKLGFFMKEDEGVLEIYPGVKSSGLPIDFLYGHDVRAVAVIIIAALQCHLEVKVVGIEHLDRGYAKFIEKLQTCGANIFIEELETAEV